MTLQELLETLFPGKAEAWMTLLKTTGVMNLHHFRDTGTPIELIDNLNECLQKMWLRPSGKERWEVLDTHLSEEQKSIILKALKELGLYCEIQPDDQYYDGVILMDGWEHSSRLRVGYLVKQWHLGLRFKRLYVMVVDRPLVPEFEPIAHALSEIGMKPNESDMMKYLVSEAMKDPHLFEDVDIIYVHADKPHTAQRATTSENFISWEHHHGVGGEHYFHDHKILIVTNQPYVAYQCVVAAQKFSKNFSTKVLAVNGKETHFMIFGKYEIESIGEGADPSHCAVGLDTLARYFYASRERWNLHIFQ